MPQRRRTQIRLAQRAYRNRKETAIQTLEKKVSSLQDSNEEMSRAFMSLYDAAVAQGLLVSAPSFGRELQATTERFVALARRAGDAESVDGGGVLGVRGCRMSLRWLGLLSVTRGQRLAMRLSALGLRALSNPLFPQPGPS